jgi:2-C-methyl-D-erythritol 4-phosphate cytidylyltransferase
MTDSSAHSRPRYWAIIPAAGIGSRMQADRPKQYLSMAGKTVLEHTLDCFINNPQITATYIAIANDDLYWPTLGLQGREGLFMVNGGQERCHSVFNALLHLLPNADENDWVLVHDAARPCLRKDDIDYLIETLAQDPVGGLLAMPVRDTMKRAGIDGRVDGTVDRVHLWHALTPQMFRVGELFRAIKSALDQNSLITDEASAIELAGKQPCLVEGHADNIKITQPEDLSLAEFFLLQQGRI